MQRWLALVVMIALAAYSAADEGTPLDGKWTATAAERNGKPAPEIKGHELVFKDGKFTIRANGKVLYAGTFKTDPVKKPARILFEHQAEPLKGKTWLGIYALEGDQLKICDNAADLSKGRPTSFETSADSGHTLVTFKRDK